MRAAEVAGVVTSIRIDQASASGRIGLGNMGSPQHTPSNTGMIDQNPIFTRPSILDA
jgi:hypothetical protein